MAETLAPVTAEEFDGMVRRAALVLPAGEREDLRYGYNHLLKWIGELRRDWPWDAEPAHRFDPPGGER